jgi:hypothetical protein
LHDAGLQRRGREDRFKGFTNTLEAIGHGNKDVGHAAGLEIVEDLEPDLRATRKPW